MGLVPLHGTFIRTPRAVKVISAGHHCRHDQRMAQGRAPLEAKEAIEALLLRNTVPAISFRLPLPVVVGIRIWMRR